MLRSLGPTLVALALTVPAWASEPKATATFPSPAKVEQQKFPFLSETLGGVELDMTRQTAANDDGTFLLVSVGLAPLTTAPALKSAKPEEQEALLATAMADLVKQVTDRFVRSVSGKITDSKPVQLPMGKGTTHTGDTVDEGGQPSGAFVANVVVTGAPALYVVLAATRGDKPARDKGALFVKSFAVPGAAGKR